MNVFACKLNTFKKQFKEYGPQDAIYPPHLWYVHPLYFLLKKKMKPNKYCDSLFCIANDLAWW